MVLTLAALAAALVAQRQLTAGPAGAGADLAPVMAQGTVLVNLQGRVVGLTARPGTVSLAFTAGSGGDLAPQLTAALRRLGVPGTFFVQAAQAGPQQAAIRQQVAADDDVGLACPCPVLPPDWWLGAALISARSQLEHAGAPGTALIQPPGTLAGAPTSATLATAKQLARLGYAAVLADRSAQVAGSPQDVPRALRLGGLASAGQGPGLVLALADTGRPGLAALRALPGVVAELQRRGYRFTTVSTAFALSSRPARVAPLAAAGVAAVLRAAQVALVLTPALGWLFLVASGLIAARIAVLLAAGVTHKLRSRRARALVSAPVSVIIPAYNERAGIVRCLASMLFCDYPSVEVILVDDGSTDGTADVVEELGLPVAVVRQANAGKAAALNAGVRCARHDLLVFADGDTMFEPSTIRALVAPFADPRVGAVAGSVKVANQRGPLGQIQYVDYVLASSLERRLFDVLGCMTTVPGAVGAFRREALADAGSVPSDTLAEDTDLTIMIGELGWRVRFADSARAWTEAPSTLGQLWSQRHRWSYGTIQTLWKHRRTWAPPRDRRALAWFGLPYLFFMTCVLPLISPVTDLYFVIETWWSPWRGLVLGGGYLIGQGTLTLSALLLDRERLRYLWTVLFLQVGYRQLAYLVAVHSMATALVGVRLRWHKLARAGIPGPAAPGFAGAGKQ
jgi:cellulose synthase/poly-beta-1,6-N-acetylglucosamine synthase-like glycosyltransferase/peptidoglycan/xylan/chitin deacetylase (PgdA/CDA1 family)